MRFANVGGGEGGPGFGPLYYYPNDTNYTWVVIINEVRHVFSCHIDRYRIRTLMAWAPRTQRLWLLRRNYTYENICVDENNLKKTIRIAEKYLSRIGYYYYFFFFSNRRFRPVSFARRSFLLRVFYVRGPRFGFIFFFSGARFSTISVFVCEVLRPPSQWFLTDGV